MRLTEIITESTSLEEGPLLNKIGTGIGKAVGSAAKGVGSVAGGVVGIGKAIRKGYKAGKDTVGTAGDDPAAPRSKTSGQGSAATGTAPQGQAAAPTGSTTAPATGNAPAATPTAAPKSTFGKLSAAANGQAPAAANPKASSALSQAQKAIAGLNPKQKSELIAMLQKQVGNAPAAKPAAPTAKPSMGATRKPAGRIEPTMEPTGAAPTKPAANFNNQLAGGKQTVSTGSKFDPTTMKNTPVKGNVQGGVPQGNYDGKTGKPVSDKAKADVASMADYKASPKGKEMDAWNDAVDAAAAAGQKPPTLADFRASQSAPATTTSGKVLRKPMALQKPALTKSGTVKQKQLTPTGFGQMVTGLTKKG